jgi:hypothetical protein
MKLKPLYVVIAGLDPAIHDPVPHHLLSSSAVRQINMDVRVKPANDQ